MKNILTVDLEDWFSVETFNSVFDSNQWEDLPATVEKNTLRILDIFSRRKVKATFFVLGWVAERYPHLILQVVDRGHEIACHSYYHRMVSSLTPDEFEKDTEKVLEVISRTCNTLPQGYRSPSWGMRRDMVWAYEILNRFGFKYDSSIFPIHHDIYGDPTAPRDAYYVDLPNNGSILEIPASTIEIMGRRIPVGGGGWLRQLPYWFTRRSIRKLNGDGIPAVVYFHPWELDDNLPRVKLDIKNRIRQYGNLSLMEGKVIKLLDDFDFGPVSEYINSLKSNGRKPGK